MLQAPKGREINTDEDLSKQLSWLLRHGAVKKKLDMRPDGFVLLSAVFPHVQAGATVPDVERIVRESDKQRFKLEDIDGQLYVRANQGHSISTVPCPLPELL